MAASSRRHLARLAAPAAFLLGVTIAVLLIRAGLGGRAAATTAPRRVSRTAPAPPPARARTTTHAARAASRPRYYTVRKGDTFGSIAAREGTSVAALERLNPGVSSNALQVGQRLRVK